MLRTFRKQKLTVVNASYLHDDLSMKLRRTREIKIYKSLDISQTMMCI